MTNRFYFLAGNLRKFFKEYDKKLCHVVRIQDILKKVFYCLQKIITDNFSPNFGIVNDTCIQKVKIGHLVTKFRDKDNFCPQVLFPVFDILRHV